MQALCLADPSLCLSKPCLSCPLPTGPLWLQEAHLGSPGQSHRKILDLVTSQQPPYRQVTVTCSGGQDADILGGEGSGSSTTSIPWDHQVPTNLLMALSEPVSTPPRAEVHPGPRLCPSTREARCPLPPSPSPPWAHPKTPGRVKASPYLQAALAGAVASGSHGFLLSSRFLTHHACHTLSHRLCPHGWTRSVPSWLTRGLSCKGYPVSAGVQLHGQVMMGGQADRCKDGRREGAQLRLAQKVIAQ